MQAGEHAMVALPAPVSAHMRTFSLVYSAVMGFMSSRV